MTHSWRIRRIVAYVCLWSDMAFVTSFLTLPGPPLANDELYDAS